MNSLYVRCWNGLFILSVSLALAGASSGCSKQGSGAGWNIDLGGSGGGGTTAATVTGVSPDKGFSGGNTEVTINGSNFVSGATVSVGGQPCSPVVFISASQLTCTTSAHADASNLDVVVTNPGTTATTLPAAFTYQTAPTITGISPATGALTGGSTVTIEGSALSSTATVTVGGQTCENVQVNASQTQLTCTLPAGGAGSATVAVTNPGAAAVNAPGGFTYVAPPNPTSVDVASGGTIGGATLVITGTAFHASATVTLGGSACAVTAANATTITCTTPIHAAGLVHLVVTNPDAQTGTLNNAYTFKTFGAIAQSTTIPSVVVSATDGTLTSPNSPAAGGNSVSVAVHPTLPIVYNAYSANVRHFSMAPATGQLTEVGSNIASETNPSCIIVHPTGKWAYVTNKGSDNTDSVIHRFDINQTTGILSDGPTYSSPTGVNASWISITPDGKYAYVVYDGSTSVAGFSINTTTGALTHFADYTANVGSNPRSVVVDPTGKYVYVVHYAAGSAVVSGFNINALDGTLTSHGAQYPLPGSATGSTSVTVEPSGKFLYVANNTNQLSLFSINAINGQLSGGTDYTLEALSAPKQVVADPTGKYLYVVNSGTAKVLIYSINATTGELSGPDSLTGLTAPKGIAFTRQ